MLIDQQLACTNMCFSHFSDKFISHFSIPKSKFWRLMGRNGHKPTLFLLLYIYIYLKKYMYTFFQFSSHPLILISGILGKNEVRPPLFIYIFHPQIQISASFGINDLGPNWLNIHLCLGIAKSWYTKNLV